MKKQKPSNQSDGYNVLSGSVMPESAADCHRMSAEAGADVAHGWHVFLLWVCTLYGTQIVEFLVFLRKYPVVFFVRAHKLSGSHKNKIITLPVQPGAAEIPRQKPWYDRIFKIYI